MMSAVPSARPDLNDRHVAVVTGASAGIGRATAVAFARKGWAVALIARSERGLNDARREVQEVGGEALVIPADVADPEAIDAASDRVAAARGGIDVWVNNAVATVYAPVVDTTPAEFRRVTLNIVLKDEAMPSLNEQLTAQIRNLRIVEDAVAKTSEEVRKLDRESLRLEASQRQEREIRQKAFETLGPKTGKDLQDRAAWARAQVRFYMPDAVQRRAKFDTEDAANDAIIRSDFEQPWHRRRPANLLSCFATQPYPERIASPPRSRTIPSGFRSGFLCNLGSTVR